MSSLRESVKDEVANLVEEKLTGKGGNVSQEDDEVPDDGTNPEE